MGIVHRSPDEPDGTTVAGTPGIVADGDEAGRPDDHGPGPGPVDAPPGDGPAGDPTGRGGTGGDGPGDDGAQRDGEGGPTARRPSPLRTALEWGGIIVGAFLVALVVKALLVQAFYIPSASMVPTLEVGDRIIVNKLSYRLGDVDRGDIVVFERPPNEPPSTIKDLVKRVVALPGETIESRDGRLWIDDQPLEEPYLRPGVLTQNVARQVVPPGHLFVMGDNRGDSRDSRFFGPIDESLVVGRAVVRVWPLTDVGGL